jgi:hypothetical protein
MLLAKIWTAIFAGLIPTVGNAHAITKANSKSDLLDFGELPMVLCL